MTKIDLKSYFNFEDVPTEIQFSELIDSIGEGSYIVAASDAPNHWKYKADYTCDGISDNVEILAAIAALGAMGGTVVLSPGNFYCTSTVTISTTQFLILKGQGVRSTILNFDLIALGDCFSIAPLVYDTVFRDFKIDGDSTNTGKGIHIQTGSAYLTFYNLVIDHCTVDGFSTDSGSSQIYCENLRIYGRNGLTCYKLYIIAATFVHCYAIAGPSVIGFDIHGTGITLTGCISDNVYTAISIGIYSNMVNIIGGYLESVSLGISITGAAPNQPKGITIIGMGLWNIATNEAVVIGTSDNVTIVGLRTHAVTSNVDFLIKSTATRVRLINCYPESTTKYSIEAGAQVSIDDPDTHPTQNQGAAATIADGGTIDHGLWTIPTYASVAGSVAGEIVTVTTLDATHITVAIKKHDGSAGTIQTIYWGAEV